MKPETASYLDKAHTLLAEAEAILGIHLHEAAGRTVFHAAQALIFEKTGRTPKTHSGGHRNRKTLCRPDRHPAGRRITPAAVAG
ncbi:hypothetical protein [Rhodopila globiformis]|uniref:HEPN domain-containing protein n=1 Tax=Rhodopila globiformis TaxID=1071 RepID=A0A2S6NLT8_RHOGL|nr:hypothetical protein [Rhodopila globiformis]PPQ36468.1 hypothetical protein CCS01_04990 [Rhodopila globiformis]